MIRYVLFMLMLLFGCGFLQISASAQESIPYSAKELDSLRIHYGVFYNLDTALKYADDVRFLNLQGTQFRKFPEEILLFPNLWGIRFPEVRVYYTEEELRDRKIKLINDVFTYKSLEKYREEGYEHFVYVRDPPLKKVLKGRFNGIPNKLLRRMTKLEKLEVIELEGTGTSKRKGQLIKKMLPNVTVLPDQHVDD